MAIGKVPCSIAKERLKDLNIIVTIIIHKLLL